MAAFPGTRAGATEQLHLAERVLPSPGPAGVEVGGEQLYALVLVELGLEIARELQPVTNVAIRCFLCLACRVTALWPSGDVLIAGGGT